MLLCEGQVAWIIRGQLSIGYLQINFLSQQFCAHPTGCRTSMPTSLSIFQTRRCQYIDTFTMGRARRGELTHAAMLAPVSPAAALCCPVGTPFCALAHTTAARKNDSRDSSSSNGFSMNPQNIELLSRASFKTSRRRAFWSPLMDNSRRERFEGGLTHESTTSLV